MTWEQKFNEVFPYIEKTTILAGEDGIFKMYGDDYSNLETAIVDKDRYVAQKHYNENFDRFQAYKKAWKLYKKYPGPKETKEVGNTWSQANIQWRGDKLYFPVPRDMEINTYLLKASRMLAHWEVRVTKGIKSTGYRNAEVR